MKLIFLEVVHQALYSGKVWGNRFFSILYTLSRSLQQKQIILMDNFAKTYGTNQLNNEKLIAIPKPTSSCSLLHGRELRLYTLPAFVDLLTSPIPQLLYTVFTNGGHARKSLVLGIKTRRCRINKKGIFERMQTSRESNLSNQRIRVDKCCVS